VGALRAKRQAWRLECKDRPGQRRSRGFKGNVMGDRAGGRRAAKGAGLKVGVGSAMVGMMVMGCRHSRQPDGTQFQGERYAAGRHEAGGNIGPEQKHRQQPEAGRASSPIVKGGVNHQEPISNQLGDGGQEYTVSGAFFSADREIPWSNGAWRCKTLGRTLSLTAPIRRRPPAIPPARLSFECPWSCRLG
jgi:hypothetical protein